MVPSPVEFLNRFQQKSVLAGCQRVIMSVINNDRFEYILSGFPRAHPDRVRLASLQAPYSGAWLTTGVLLLIKHSS